MWASDYTVGDLRGWECLESEWSSDMELEEGTVAESQLIVERAPVASVGETLTIVLNRPDKVNAMTESMLTAMDAALDEAECADEIRVVILRGTGSRGFCAGLDRGEMDRYAEQGIRPAGNVAEMYRIAKRIDLLPKPVVSLVHGHCIGAGTQIAAAADIVIAAEGAKISEPEPRMGGFADDEWLRRIGHVMGPMRAKSYLLIGIPLSGREAVEAGIASMVVPDAELLDAGLRVADRLADMRPTIVAKTLQLIDEGATGGWRAATLGVTP